MTRHPWRAALIAGALAASPARAQAPTTDAPTTPDAPAANTPATDTPGLVTTASAHSMAETEARFVRALEGAGLKLAARIDHSANARGVDLALPPTVLLVFGNPRNGTLLMQENRAVGIDLPLKVLIWEEGGAVKLAYNDADTLAQRYGLGQAAVLAAVAQALERFAAAATQP